MHSVSCRLKAKDSLARKVAANGSKYTCLKDITDVAGVRIITFFQDDVDMIAGIIEREFTIDHANSVDKRALLDPERFGYLSMHHVVNLSPDRASLPEYRRFAGLKLEIQTRSILQHAWAEIEHDLGYKAGFDVPRTMRRRFARLAGILEVVDEEFAALRDGLRKYEKQVPKQISQTPSNVELNKASLNAFIATNSLVAEIDRKLADIFKTKRIINDPNYLEGIAEHLTLIGIRTIAELEAALQDFYQVIPLFTQHWLSIEKPRKKYEFICAGISLFYLWYVKIARNRTLNEIRQLLDTCTIGAPKERDELPQKILDSYSAAVQELSQAQRPHKSTS